MLRISSLLAFFVLSLAIGGTVSSCNTVEGFGEDISAAARGVRERF